MHHVKTLRQKIAEIYSPYYFFAFFCLFSILLSFFINELIITDEVFYKSYAERYNINKIQQLAETISKVEWILYLLTPILYFFKFLLVSSILLVGDFVYDYKIGSQKLFQVVMIAETIFLLPDLVKLIWFLFFEQAETIKHVGSFEFLSIYSLFKNEDIYSWLRYPFSVPTYLN